MHRSVLFLAGSALALGVGTPAAAQSPAPSAIDQLTLRPTTVPAAVPPADEPTTGRVVRVQPIPAIEPIDDTVTGSIQVRRPQGDPYEALGIRVEGLMLYPALTVGLGHTSNAAGAGGGTASAYATLSPELLIRTDWSRHEATVDFRGTYRHFFSDSAADRPELTAAATARLDVSHEWTVPLAAAYTFRTQSPSAADFPAGVDAPPGVHEWKSSAGANYAGLATLQAAVNLDRTAYDDGRSGGVVVNQGDRTNTVLGARVRAGYPLSPALVPFVEGEIGRRQFDRTVDAGGLRRSGLLQYYRAGIALDSGPILTGELKLGYGIATFDDPSLATIGAFTADADLMWSPTVLTRVTLDGSTSLNPSAAASSSGSIVYEGGLDVAYAWRRNITLGATARARHERFQGTGEVDTGAKAGIAATWKANRMLWLVAGYEHEWLVSTVAGRGFASDAVRVELRAQR